MGRALSQVVGERLNAAIASRGSAHFSEADLKFVRAQRARGAGWTAIARMLGRPIPDVQVHFEPLLAATTFVEPTAISAVDVRPELKSASVAKEPPASTAPRRRRPPPFELAPDTAAWRIALKAIARKPSTTAALAVANAWRPATATLALLACEDRDLAFKRVDGRWEITKQGRALLGIPERP